MEYTAGSLFTGGVAGMDIAFEAVGFNILWQVENDTFNLELLNKRYPNVEKFGDVRNVRSEQLRYADVLFGGFPCQDISSAGKGGGIKQGNRSGLWYEFARIISDLRPRYVLLENVERIISKGRGWDVVLGTLTEIGYDVWWKVVRASDVGAPHKRARWIGLAYPHMQRCESEDCTVRRHSFHKDWISSEEVQERSNIEFGVSRTGEVAYSPSEGLEGTERQELQRNGNGPACGGPDMAHANGKRLEGWHERQECAREQSVGTCSQTFQRERRIESGLGRMFNGRACWMDRSRWPAGRDEEQFSWEPPRTAVGISRRRGRLTALGNAVVPQLILPYAHLIKTLLEEEDGTRIRSG